MSASVDEIVAYVWRGRLLALKKRLEALIGGELHPSDLDKATEQLASGKGIDAVAAYFKKAYGISPP